MHKKFILLFTMLLITMLGAGCNSKSPKKPRKHLSSENQNNDDLTPDQAYIGRPDTPVTSDVSAARERKIREALEQPEAKEKIQRREFCMLSLLRHLGASSEEVLQEVKEATHSKLELHTKIISESGATDIAPDFEDMIVKTLQERYPAGTPAQLLRNFAKSEVELMKLMLRAANG
ncbi:MAG: hypothetical protein ROO73_03980 [Roseivirga sp.]